MSKSNIVKDEPTPQTREQQSTNELPGRSEPVRRPASSVVRKAWQDTIQNTKGQQDYFKGRLLRLALRADELAADGSQASRFRKTDNEDVFRQEAGTVENDIKTFIRQIPIEEQHHVLKLYRDTYDGLSALLSQWLNNMGGFLDANSSYAEAIYGWVVDFSGTLRKYVESQPTKDTGTNADLASTKQKNEQTISQLIAQGEGHALEFKETLEYDVDVKVNKNNKDVLLSALKTIAGLLNSNGGTLLIGVNDSGEIKGIERDLSTMKHGDNDRFEQKIRNCMRDRFSPQPIGKVKISFEKFTEGTICRVDVPANKDIIHLDGDIYIRDGNTTQKPEGRNRTDWIQKREN